MKKFLIIQKENLYGFISSNLKNSTWGIKEESNLDELLLSLKEDYGNISVSFPKSVNDDLDTRDQLAYMKLAKALNDVILKKILEERNYARISHREL